MTKSCLQCNTEYFVKRYRFEISKYCSNQCYGAAKNTQANRDCLQCQKTFKIEVNAPDVYCSRACYYESRKGSGTHFWKGGVSSIQRTCATCLTNFFTSQKEIDRGQGRGSFCSHKCKGKAMRGTMRGRPFVPGDLRLIGPNNPSWKGGITPEITRIRHSLQYTEWRTFVFKRDDYTCQMCGKRGGRLNANHIKKFSDYPELRVEPENGITLCYECHFRQVNGHETEWESYFNFNLETRGYING